MFSRILRSGLGCLMLVCFVQGAWAADADTLQIGLCGGKGAEVSLGQLANGQVCLRVSNPTLKTRVLVQIRVIGFHLRKPDGSISSVKVSVESRANLSIAGLDSESLSLGLEGSDKKQIFNIMPGTYTGVIAITDTDPETKPPTQRVVPFNLQLTVSGPHSAVASLTRWVYRRFPWAHVNNFRFAAPLSEPVGRPVNSRRYVLQTDRGHTAIVTPITAEANAAVEEVPFEVSEFDKAGKYEGQIEMAAADGNTVTATINVKDCFVWPLLVMLLGVLIAQVTKQSVKYIMGAADKSNQLFGQYLIGLAHGELFRSAVALVLAFLTAFKTLYIGKAFGTPSDYIDIFMSGTAVKLSVDLLAFGVVYAVRRRSSSA